MSRSDLQQMLDTAREYKVYDFVCWLERPIAAG